MVLGGTLGRLVGDGEHRRLIATVTEGTPVFVDLFRSGRWVGATSFAAAADGVPLSELLPPNLGAADPSRLQLRLDPFSASNAVTLITGSNALAPRFDRALDELRVVEMPPSESSYRQAEHRLAENRSRVRWLVVGAVLIAGVCAVALVVRRGFVGAIYARRTHAAAGGGRRDPRLWVGVLVAAVTVSVAFAAAAAWFAWRTAIL